VGTILRLLLFLFAAIVLLALFVLLYFQLSPRIGSDPSGARLEQVRASPNYRDGKFHNLEDTGMDIPWRTIVKVLLEGVFGGPGREPREPIPTTRFDRQAWEAVPDSSFAVAWFGHSTVLVKVDGITLLCDPVFSERGSAFSFIGPKRFPYTHHYSLEELPQVDVVLQSHDHYDHLDHASVLHLKHSVRHWLMPLGVGAHLEHWGVDPASMQEFDWWQGTQVHGLILSLVPTRHFSGRALTNRFSTLWGGWVIKGSRHTILFGGDSGNSAAFQQIGDRFGPFDLVMVECGAYNEAWSDIHFMPEEIPAVGEALQARALMPIHWGKFDLALHPWKEPIQRLSTAMRGSGARLFTPRIGTINVNADPAASVQWWEGLE
jgi:L-ascorbate metabolism protein UlaG (beta-lactamase superfamily)